MDNQCVLNQLLIIFGRVFFLIRDCGFDLTLMGQKSWTLSKKKKT